MKAEDAEADGDMDDLGSTDTSEPEDTEPDETISPTDETISQEPKPEPKPVKPKGSFFYENSPELYE